MRPRGIDGRQALVVATMAALATFLGCTRDRPRTSATNVLLISLDSTRRDLFSMYGRHPTHAPEQSTCPHLAKLAQGGVILDQAYATSSWTLPSHLSLLSGEPELVHAVDTDNQRLDPERPLLSQLLHQNGYRTAGFFSGPYLDPHFGFNRGFDRYEARYGPKVEQASRASARARQELREAGRTADPARLQAAMQAVRQTDEQVEKLSHRDISSRAVTDGVIEELQRAARDKQPFFIFAHYFDPHFDYAPPPPYDRLFDPEYAGDLDGSDWIRNPKVAGYDQQRAGIRTRVISDRDLEHIQALYEGELAWTDSQIGRALDRLDALGLAGNTLVIVTADHGDEFFEHGAIGHRTTLFEEVTQIPMILRLPGRVAAGIRMNGLVSNAAVVPTVLELLGLPAPHGLSSSSFLSLLQGHHGSPVRHVMGRLVRTYKRTLFYPTKEGTRIPVPGQQIVLIETWHQGSLKLKRERVWPVAVVKPPPEASEYLAALRLRYRRQEKLAWLDLATHPGERPEDWSTQFKNPRALAALRAFHDTYTALVARRGRPDTAQKQQLLNALRGLGYVGGSGTHTESDEFSLPPPGEILLQQLNR